MTSGEYYTEEKTSLNLEVIGKLQRELEAVKWPLTMMRVWEEQSFARAVFLTNHLLGGEVSWETTKDLLKGKKEPVNKEEQRVVNYGRVLGSLGQVEERRLRLGQLMRWQQILVKGVGEVRWRGNEPKMQAELEELLTWMSEDKQINPLLMAGVVEKQVQELQPWESQSELMARLLGALVLKRAGLGVNRLWVVEEYFSLNKKQYLEKLKRASDGDYAWWLDYYVKGVRFGMQLNLEALGRMSEAMLKAKKLTKAEKAVWHNLELSGQLRNLGTRVGGGKLSRQRVHVILQSLVKKGILEKVGQGRKVSYILEWREWGRERA